MITFKEITESDIETVVPLMQEFYAIDGYPMDPIQSKVLFTAFISDEKLGKSWLLFFENKVAGYAILTFVFSFEYGGTIAFIDELYVTENFRGKGIGTKTVEFLKSEAAKFTLKLLYLEVENHNSNAQKVYLAAGFELHNRKIMKYKVQ